MAIKKTTTAKKVVTKKSLPKAQLGKIVKPTADSTNYYNYKAKVNFQKASDRYGLASPEMRKQATEYTNKAFKAQNDALRQLNKGKPGFDKNGYPIKKSTTKKKG
jgi:hypothetical protein